MDYQWRDPEPLARAVVLWLWIWLAAQTLYTAAAAAFLVELSVLSPEAAAVAIDMNTEPSAGGWAVGITALAYFPVLLVSGFLTLKWIHRVNANAQTLAEGMSVTPGWNVGFFFIPIANLFKPYQGVRDSWKVSHKPRDWNDAAVPGLLPAWWALWVVTTILGNISFRISMRDNSLSGTMAGLGLDLAGGLLGIPLGLLLIRIVRRLTKAQIEAAHAAAFA